MTDTVPWQLKMFRKTLKKKLRLKEFKKYLGRISADQQCLLVTCGDNNGAMNVHLRSLGGQWQWADIEAQGLAEMSALLGDEVKQAGEDTIPFSDNTFHYAISIDVHEHLEDAAAFTRELHRVTRRDGHILITVPGGDNKKVVNIIKNKLGMTKEKYGHARDGYRVAEIEALMSGAGIRPCRHSTFSRFFTELIELGINFLYVKVLSKRGESGVEEGTIAPQSAAQVKSVGKSYRLYSLVYPFFWLISQLDRLLPFSEGYVVLVEGCKER